MKTLFKTFAYAAIAALALSSCAKEKLQPADELTGKLVTVHFGTENTDPSTKATLTPDAGETAFKAAWENGDEISIEYISPDAKNDIIVGTWDATNKKFSALLPYETGSWAYSAAYPVPSTSDNSVDFGANRTQKGNAYNSKYDIMIGAAGATNAEAGKDNEGKDIVFKMDRQTAIAYFHFTSDLDEAITSATLTVGGDGAAIASSSAHISNFAWAPTKDCTSITLTFPEEAPNAQNVQLWFNVLPTSYSSMTLTVETDTKTFTISKNSKGKYEAGKLYKVKKGGISWTDKPTTIFFYESFDKTIGTGGNDDAWSGSIASNNVIYDNKEWNVSNEGGASKCLKLGTGSKKGSATTPSLGINTSKATLWFKAAAWNASKEKTTINLSIIGAGTIAPTSVNLVKGQWSEYDCTITGADATTKIKFEAANAADNRFFIDEVYVYSGTTTPGSGSGEGGGETGGGEPGGGTNYFVKVTSAPTDWSGEYLIVCEDQNVAFDGSLNTLDVASNNVSVTITENRIKADDNLLNSTFTINAEGTTIQSKSGYYIGGKSTKDNGIQTSKTDSYNHTLSINTAGEFVAYTTLGNNISNYLRCNPNNGNQWFRYYKSSSYTVQKAVQLYKLEN